MSSSLPTNHTSHAASSFYPPGSFSAWNAAAPTHETPRSFQLPSLRDTLTDQENAAFRLPPFTQIPPVSSYHRYAANGFPTPDHPTMLQPSQPLLPAPLSATPLADVVQNIPPAHRRNSAKPVTKVAGARRPVTDGKGKAPNTPTKPRPRPIKRQAVDADLDITPTVTKKARGRSSGAANYKDEDLDALTDIVEEILPIGKKGWNTVGVRFAQWARENGRPERTADTLEKKFKWILHLEKPTGQADCPSWLDRAHAADLLMDEKAITRDIDDEDIADETIELTDSSAELDEEFTMALLERKPRKAPAPKVKKEPTSPPLTVSRRAQTATLARITPRNGAGNDFLKSISSALDPRTRAAMTDERASRSILNTQVFNLTNQLRDERTRNDALLTRISDLERERSDLLRKIDRLELVKELQDVSASAPSRSARTPVQYKKRRRQDITYGDGWATNWVGSDESDHRRDSPTTRRYTHDDSPTPVQPRSAQPSPEKTTTAA